MISQSITFPQALWEWLFDSHSLKACGNDVVISKYFKTTKVVGTSVPTKVVSLVCSLQRKKNVCVSQVVGDMG